MNVGGGEATMVMDEFVLDAPLDDALFSLDPPAGYKLKEQELDDAEVRQARGRSRRPAAGLLRRERRRRSPRRLSDWAAFNEVKAASTTRRSSMKVGGVSGRLFGLRDGYGYAGKGVKPRREGQDRVLVSTARDRETYRAVFGDLRIEDVTADKLPATQRRDGSESARVAIGRRPSGPQRGGSGG